MLGVVLGQARNTLNRNGTPVAMNFFQRLFTPAKGREVFLPLYKAVVAEARLPVWYADGAVPDTLDGRFDMVGAILSLILIRLESEGVAGQEPAVLLTEIFVDDMDGQLREEGIGDIIVGKHIGKMMSALGGRIAAYRTGIEERDTLDGALIRNLYRGEVPAPEKLKVVRDRFLSVHAQLKALPLTSILSGMLST